MLEELVFNLSDGNAFHRESVVKQPPVRLAEWFVKRVELIRKSHE